MGTDRFHFSFFEGLSWVVGDAQDLPFDDDKFDFYTIAFGIRNVTHMDQVSVCGPMGC